ncbi:MAG TPA: hypothetical protein VFS15_03810 [Kofleriaceae bacterium]|nr:hypothetical protein [Kofleriaceae bacterium]
MNERNHRSRFTTIALAAAGIAMLGLFFRGMGPELVRYLKIRRM